VGLCLVRAVGYEHKHGCREVGGQAVL